MTQWFIEGNEITNDIIEDLDTIQVSGLLTGEQSDIIPESVIISVDNHDGKYDADLSLATYGPGNDGHGQVLECLDEFGQTVWAGYISRWEMFDDQKSVEIEALSYIGKVREVEVTFAETTDTPSAIIQTLLEDKVSINSVWIDQASFTAEDSFDTANGLSCYINIPTGSEVNAMYLLQKLCLIFNKRIYIFKNILYIGHLFKYTGVTYQSIDPSDIHYEMIKRKRDFDRACNSVLIAYNNAQSLVWVERDLTDTGKTVAEYQANILKYGIKYYFNENTFLTDRDGTTVIMSHATSASATYIADQLLEIFGEAPLIAEIKTDLQEVANRLRWNDLPLYANLMLSFITHTGITYSDEPVEIEYKKTMGKSKEGIMKVRFIDKYPKNFGLDTAIWSDDIGDWETMAWE